MISSCRANVRVILVRLLAIRDTSIALVIFVALLLTTASHADAPATEFFAVETTKLAKLAPTDAALDTLSAGQLADVCIAHGVYEGGLAMQFLTQTFRIDARFSAAADLPGRGPASIDYHIDASNNQTSWSLLAVHGRASKQGKQFITDNWRKQPITVVLRFLNLKQ